MAIFIFDLYGTLVEKDDYRYDAALKWLSSRYFYGRFYELKKLSELIKTKHLELRNATNKEFSFIEQLNFFQTKMKVSIEDDLYLVELEFLKIFRKDKLKKGVLECLDYLSRYNQKCFVLTNSIFSGNNLKVLLRNLGIDNYICKVYSSADIGYRKPSENCFSFVDKDIEIRRKQDVFFIGDSYQKDYLGAKEYGFTPILLSNEITSDGQIFENMTSFLFFLERVLRLEN